MDRDYIDEMAYRLCIYRMDMISQTDFEAGKAYSVLGELISILARAEELLDVYADVKYPSKSYENLASVRK